MGNLSVQNGKSVPLDVHAATASGSSTGQASSIFYAIQNIGNGQYWNGSAFTGTFAELNGTEVSATNQPGVYSYSFAPNIQDFTARVFVRTSNAALLDFPFRGSLTFGDVPDNFDILSINGSGQVASTGGSAPTAAQVADAVWDEAIAEHLTAGSTGNKLNTASSGGVDLNALADAVWDELLSGHTIAGSTGKKLSDLTGVSSDVVDTLNAILAEARRLGVVVYKVSAASGKIYRNQKGDDIKLPFYKNGALEDTSTYTNLKMLFRHNSATTPTEKTATFLAGGLAKYTTANSDGIFEIAGRWHVFASGLDSSGRLRYSEDDVITVEENI